MPLSYVCSILLYIWILTKGRQGTQDPSECTCCDITLVYFFKTGRTPKINIEKLRCECRSTHLAISRKESLNSYEIWIISFDCSLFCSSLMETINTIFRQKKLLISVFTDLIEYILNNLPCLPLQLWNTNTTIILQYVILPLWHYSRMSLSCSERSMWHYEIQNRRISQK